MIDEKGLIDKLTMCMEKEKFKCDQMADLNLKEAVVKYSHGKYCYANALHLVQSQQKVNEWIPFTQRKMTTEEKEEMNTDFDYILDCKLPDDGTEILVCSKFGHVFMDTFINDGDGCYLDSGYEFIEDAIAWMPLPEPYKE